VGRFQDGEIEVVHDHHPDATGLDGVMEQYGVFIPVNPGESIDVY
jgi:hypothetical protein